MLSKGAIYVAYGPAAVAEARKSIHSLRLHNPDLPVAILSDSDFAEDVQRIHFFDDPGPGARWAKLNVLRLSPFDLTLYLDADTRIAGEIGAGFRIIEDGWDMAIAPSPRQGSDILGHLDDDDRHYTLNFLGCSEPLGLQAGVFFFGKSSTVQSLFKAWQAEWQWFIDQDQGALLRALWQVQARVWLLGQEWNNGELVQHLFGRARRTISDRKQRRR